jgi:hypothetical protein
VKGMMRRLLALGLAALFLAALAAPAGAAPAAAPVPVTGTVVDAGGSRGDFSGTLTPRDLVRDGSGQLILVGTLSGTAMIDGAVYTLTGQPFAAPVTLAADADCTTLTVTYGRASLGVQDLALALDPVTMPIPARLRGKYC